MNEDAKDGLYKKQTVIDWLEKEIANQLGTNSLLEGLYKKAKEMHKEEIIRAACFEPFLGNHPKTVGEEYYNENYGK